MSKRQNTVLNALKKIQQTKSELRNTCKVSSIFGVLNRLRDKGMVDEYENDGDGGSIWAITKAGRKALKTA